MKNGIFRCLLLFAWLMGAATHSAFAEQDPPVKDTAYFPVEMEKAEIADATNKPLPQALAGAAEIVAHVDKSTITIGEKIKYTIEVISNKDTEISFPVYTASMGGFAVKDFGEEGPKKAGSDKVKRTNWYLLDTYTVGPYVIPPQPVILKFSDGRI